MPREQREYLDVVLHSGQVLLALVNVALYFRRRYFELVLKGGSNAVVFQDLKTKRWFEQRA